jgi:hypothetical protein
LFTTPSGGSSSRRLLWRPNAFAKIYVPFVAIQD